MADENTRSTDPADDEARAKAFFGDTVDTLQEASAQGWDAERTSEALTLVQRSHGYWSDTPVLGGALRHVGLGLAALALAACSGAGAADRAWEEAELPRPIFVAEIHVDGKPSASSLLFEAYEDIGRCCFHSNSNFSLRSDAPSGRALTAQDVFDAVDPRASLYAIGLPDLEDTSLVEPLFGGRMRRHVMAEPQEGCVVVSGVRDGIRRAGTISRTLETETIYSANTTADGLEKRFVDLKTNQKGVDRCNVSALLLLHGMPEEEAMDYRTYSKISEGFGDEVPDMAKLKARDLELNGPFNGYNVIETPDVNEED